MTFNNQASKIPNIKEMNIFRNLTLIPFKENVGNVQNYTAVCKEFV